MVSRTLLAWDVSADQEEPWRRLLQELSDACREELETPQVLAGYLAKIGRGGLLAHQEEISLSRRARAGNQRARKKLVERNLRLVDVPRREREPVRRLL